MSDEVSFKRLYLQLTPRQRKRYYELLWAKPVDEVRLLTELDLVLLVKQAQREPVPGWRTREPRPLEVE